MSGWLVVAAGLLALERGCYVWIARAPRSFRRWCSRPAVARLGEPVNVVRALFLAFKVLQCAVFAGWCLIYADGVPAEDRRDVLLDEEPLLRFILQRRQQDLRVRRLHYDKPAGREKVTADFQSAGFGCAATIRRSTSVTTRRYTARQRSALRPCRFRISIRG